MKKILIGVAACALLITSCQKNNVIENNQEQLTFAAGTAQQGTKAAELNNITLQGKNIALYAYQKPGAWGKWYNDVVEYSNGKWALKNSVRFRNVNATKYITYSSTIVGALTDTTNFYNANFTDKFPQFTYTVAATSAVQEDLVAGITEVDPNKTDITLGMRHILSQVNFGTVGYKGAKIQIQNIKIVNVAKTANFTYKAANTYPIGAWSTPTDFNTNYDYYNYTNVAAGVAHTLVPATATSGDRYIFGDGGNAGPGLTNVLYPDPKDGGKWKTLTARSTGLENSLMLLPQTLSNAKVTFQYKIQDVDNAYVAGSASDWETGEFKLDFSTGGTSGTHYLGKWEQNYRYVYLIDFTDFLDGVALTFKVDVEAYPWENYNHNTPGDNDGIVDVMAAGQPSQAAMNATTFVNGDTWYIASKSETDPTTFNPKKWAQVMRNETWDLSAYDFANIGVNETFDINFKNVIFNTSTDPSAGSPTTITMTLPAGYTAAKGTGITMDATGAPVYVISLGDKSADAKITITNTNTDYNSATSLVTSVSAITTDATTIYYKGTTAVDLTTMDNTGLADGKTIAVKFTSTVIPTVGATTNGLWTWNNTTKTATWKKVTWKDLSATESAFSTAASGDIIYSSDTTVDLSADFATEPTTLAKDAVVTIVFNNAASRIMPVATANGVWSYVAANNTATWTKN